MSAEYFLDTNILLYCFDSSEPRKQRIARMLVEEALAEARGAIGYQVCQEFCNVMLHKLKTPVPGDVFADYLDTTILPLVRVHSSPALFREALRIHRQTQYRYYDSLIIAAALESGAPVLYSEDLQHERRIGPLQILNPFA